MVEVCLTGDSIVTREFSSKRDPGFQSVVDVVRSSDIAFTNIEFVTPQQPRPGSEQFGGIHLAADPWVLDELSWLGFNLFGVPNNHSIDYTIAGLLDTIEALERRGMCFAGAGRGLAQARAPAFLDRGSTKVALLAATTTFSAGAPAGRDRDPVPGRPGISALRHRVEHRLPAERFAQLREIADLLGFLDRRARWRAKGYWRLLGDDRRDALQFLGGDFFLGSEPSISTSAADEDLDDICKSVTQAAERADLVVFSLHSHESSDGDVNGTEPADFVIEAAHRLIEAGADIIVGHGPHRLRGVEVFEGRPIFYSLGNFLFTIESTRYFPQEMYDQHGLGEAATASQVVDAWTVDEHGSPAGLRKSLDYWQSAMALCRLGNGGAVSEISLRPLSLGLDQDRDEAGIPRVPKLADALAIADELEQLSVDFGTRFKIEGDQRWPVIQVVI